MMIVVAGMCEECTAEAATWYMAPHNTLRFEADRHHYRLALCSGCGLHWFDERGRRCHDLPNYEHPALWLPNVEAVRDGIERRCRWCLLGSPHSHIWN